jgi:nucleotide-binding universal stress UspA family protein
MGSVSRGVVRAASCPVLVVRRAAEQVRRIVIGCDGSRDATRAVELVASLDVPRGGRVSLVNSADLMHVALALVPEDSRPSVEVQVERVNEERLTRARKALEAPAKTLRQAGWRVDPIVAEGTPLDDLLSTIEDTRADLVVIGARGETDLRYLAIGSVAEGVLNRAAIPVLVVR